ncbi:hypothetical protein N9291_00355 [bacterium]|nr:hypothetical protein [bacterium]
MKKGDLFLKIRELVFRIATRGVFMKEGKIYWQGPAEELAKTKDQRVSVFAP